MDINSLGLGAKAINSMQSEVSAEEVQEQEQVQGQAQVQEQAEVAESELQETEIVEEETVAEETNTLAKSSDNTIKVNNTANASIGTIFGKTSNNYIIQMMLNLFQQIIQMFSQMINKMDNPPEHSKKPVKDPGVVVALYAIPELD